ncbi:hypothetical protein QN219_04890 [Sinorhizobium sp. 7-81]|uniref:hypothetical protein n=1 Tax=Sinorhizobium sp. 8-89 TaxID=3049089 RepID=UPI0024C2D0E3|nr:hypothetical protein [Sinorhizobium sp. 8-89]MDK1489393.1 hypothetical protein [Sinorhizobium sp. 8-89]
MSDEAGTRTRKETALHEHSCEHPGYKKWGSFGFAVGRGEPNWFCSEHRPEWKIGPTTQASLTARMARGITEL